MEIILKEGEEIKIKAEKENTYAYKIMICYHNCIIKKRDVKILKK